MYLQENLAVASVLSLNLPKYEKTNGTDIQEYPGKTWRLCYWVLF